MFKKNKILKNNNDLLMKQNSELRAEYIENQKLINVLEGDIAQQASMITEKDEQIKNLKKEISKLKRKLTIATKENK